MLLKESAAFGPLGQYRLLGLEGTENIRRENMRDINQERGSI
jgi:hypothetical protein